MSIVGVQQPEFGRRLRQLRQERGLSQRDVAGDVVNPSYISLLETGARVPTLEVVLQIARALDVHLEALVADAVLPIKEVEQSPEANRTLVLDILARSALDVGDLDDAGDRYQSAYDSAVRDGVPSAVVERGIALQDVLILRADHQARYALLDNLVTVADQLDVPELMVKLRLDKAAAARDCGRMAEAMVLASCAMEALPDTELADTGENVRALGVLISVKVDSGDTGEIPALVDRMLACAEKLGSRTVLGRAHWAASVAFARLGVGERAERHVRHAKDMLAQPGTSIREWGRFASAAASVLLDADAELSEVDQYVNWMRSALELADSPGDQAKLVSIEARYALARGESERALELSEDEPDGLAAADLLRLRRTRGRALHRMGRTEEAVEALRSAARLGEELASYRVAAEVWREIDELRSA
ncbi:DNA-binding transcriptional regulator, XRE-family HTH domain [Actinokineospora alba]|uniref:DNA-binding transcriptional regulator, XRE-family HTH domain n=1 Tax=Actinokineospora alba TaxID=504798 RepID=A0A1H0QX25_9PSEU|nr:helix-turn-helix transcriptional regulator [Actinokineospora alba]TDP70355.1 DNA-binding XRE family transcriptional regulator [Actinokineospora alba]SDI33446.1 DNA-binding transcriptional regulator, XRE-family HTH domain [Actinokineospora alba]SDP21804.1 DNA-binding transcriptional regulator, XRE-family HTH domain [Actinokineospora alba]